MQQGDKNQSIRILIVEDDPLIAEDLSSLLSDADYYIAGIAHNAPESIEMIGKLIPDAVLLDINLGKKGSGIEVARWINQNKPLAFVYITGSADDTTLSHAKLTHPGGYLLKPFTGPDVKVALEVAISNFKEKSSGQQSGIDLKAINASLSFPLSFRELDILSGLFEGLSNKGLGEKLFVSENTVKTHLQSIYEKLGVNSRTEALAKIRQFR